MIKIKNNNKVYGGHSTILSHLIYFKLKANEMDKID